LRSWDKHYGNWFMDYLGLVLEIAFLALGIYVLLFASGKFRAKDPAAQQKAETFRKRNKVWLILAGAAVTLIMGLNILLHLRQMLYGS